MKHNSSCSGLQKACDPLLKEKVSGISFVWFYNFIANTQETFIYIYFVINKPKSSSQWRVIFQSFGIAEGGRVQDLREMAKAAGQSFPDFTPPGGETQEQVRLGL